jgi:glycosyltransferase involved in cell wall biosynthesis
MNNMAGQLNTTQKYLISIVIPTFNSESYIGKCLDSIFVQEFEKFEVIVTDGGSADNTIRIAKTYNVKIINCCRSLLRSRKTGIEAAKGEYILLMDSDQLLVPDSLSRCYNKIKEGYDALILEEKPIIVANKIMKMWSIEKSSNFLHVDKHLSPLDGSLLPRFFDSKLLTDAVKKIPEQVLDIRHPDHQILYYEVYKLSKNIGYLENIMLYYERADVHDLVKTYYRHGVDAAFLFFESTYKELILSKFVNKSTNVIGDRNRLLTAYLIFLKSFPFTVSFLLHSFKNLVVRIFKRDQL